jgi:hypothetical protein
MRKSHAAKVALLLLITATLSGCLWVADDGPGRGGGGGGRGGHGEGRGGDNHERR